MSPDKTNSFVYFFYIDDSGNRDPGLRKLRPDGSVFVKEHVYVLTAVGLFERSWVPFEAELTDYKFTLRSTLYKTIGLQTDISDCEVKSTLLRNARERAARSPFLNALTDDQRTRLAEMYYSQLGKHHMHLLAVVIDKRHLLPETSSFYLHLKAYEILLERIELLLCERYPKHKGVIVMDDSDRALNRAVAIKHARLIHLGGQRIRFRHIVEYPFFTESRLSHGVQLADLCAYNVNRAFKQEDFGYSFFSRSLPFFYNSRNTPPDKLDGLKVFPDESPLAEWVHQAYAAFLGNAKPASKGGPRENGARLG